MEGLNIAKSKLMIAGIVLIVVGIVLMPRYLFLTTKSTQEVKDDYDKGDTITVRGTITILSE